ncbi:MAG: N-acetylmuramoyl-L-alanine amidase [Acidaminococcaceae bacterium]|nr:N-acetylmuramoyl-L-alanine amidase [Acidaminococcaceae bacterium]
MFKKILLLCCCLFVCLGTGLAHGASSINKFTYGVNRDNRLRMVFDCSQKTKASAQMSERELTVTIYGKLNDGIAKSHFINNSANIKRISLEPDGKKTILHVKLKKTLSSSDYKLFALKADRVAKRPERIVVDIQSGPIPARRASGSNNNVISTAPRYARYSVAGGIKGKKITLDPGHGGTDPGAQGIDSGVQEKAITLPVSMFVKKYLEDKGAIVSMTRIDDRDVWGPDATDRQELQARVDVAENNGADMFISIHCNANPNRSVGGFSTYYHPKTDYDAQVAQCIQNRLLKTGNLDDLGIRYGNLYVNKRCSMPGALVELLFLSNRREEKLLRSNWFQQKMAKAIADGIEDFYNSRN